MISYSGIRLNHYFMAIKTFCDRCGKEIKQGDEVASIVSVEKQYILQKKGNPVPQAMSVTRLACGECFKKIKKIFEDGKKQEKA